MEHFEIRFDKGAWKSDDQQTQIKERRQYTRRVAEYQQSVEALDRFDDFSTLKIEEDTYEQKEGSDYGIKRDPDLHIYGGHHVVLDHQVNAAKKFLRDLRGFGLLADVVGSGKTFEAGIVLSELAVRNRIKSMLIVVPGQVFDSWVDVLENKFGMGQGALYQVRAPKDTDDIFAQRSAEFDYNNVLEKVGYTQEKTNAATVIRPIRPIIVDVKVFAQWEVRNNVIFDVIVVDEAHHLCKEDGEYAKAMKLLSTLMAIKKKFNAATYCLLLSATPHSGNLENMFRLWYFVRCQGGNPPDFEEKDDKNRTKDYRDEKDYYKNYMCRGATNVTDFVRKVKKSEVESQYRKEFDAWMRKRHPGERYDSMTDYGKSSLVEEFLQEDEYYEKVTEPILDSAATAYHALLRSIMIRQANNLEHRRKKYIRNVLFYPVNSALYNDVKKLQIQGLQGESITLDYTEGNRDDNFMPRVTVNATGENKSISDYIADKKGNRSEKGAYNDLISKVLGALERKGKEQQGVSGKQDYTYTKKGYVKFYSNRLDAVLDRTAWSQTTILPVEAEANNKLGYKYQYLKYVLSQNKDRRVIVFFDYELDRRHGVIDDVVAALQAEPDYNHRLILSDQANEEDVISAFDAKDDAILIVKNASLTEGANLQSCNVIVNYQVTPDPLAMDQRIGRVFRLGQKNDVTIYSFADVNKLEGFALAYFIGIGLMASNSGDATILAGSNSDQMVTIRCKVCGNVKLMSREEYEDNRRKHIEELICDHTNTEYQKTYDPCEMEEINVNEFKCDKCGSVLARSVDDEGYECLSRNSRGQSGKMCISGKRDDRSVYCSKLCAMSHCERLESIDCPVLAAYRDGQSESLLNMMCKQCDKCSSAYAKCRINNDVKGCGKCNYADCSPKPYILHFNEKWEAECPRCRDRHQRGLLRQITPKTFATYVRALWNFQLDRGGESFCDNLDKEARKVEQIKVILTKDEEKDGEDR